VMGVLLLIFVSFSFAFFPTTLRLVDHRSNGNLFFRGPEPKKIFGGFAYSSLVTAMKEEAEKQGVSMPSSFRLIDVCLLTKEHSDIAMERKFFGERRVLFLCLGFLNFFFQAVNPNLGEFSLHGTYGINITTFKPVCVAAGGNETECSNKDMQPNELGPNVVLQMAKQFPDSLGSRLIGTLQFINSMMNSQQPTIVYAHCICGCDRTVTVFVFLFFVLTFWSKGRSGGFVLYALFEPEFFHSNDGRQESGW